jgi:protein-S-isoprenylcysteine O-methyltransferase Ste14
LIKIINMVDQNQTRCFMRAFLMIGSFELVLAAVMFGAAGRMDLPWFWVLLGIHTVMMVVGALLMDPDLRRERMSFRRSGGEDRRVRLLLLPLVLLHLVVAGLDVGRFGWSGEVGLAVRVGGLVGYCAALALIVWAMTVNVFFAPVVRLQSERGHHLINSGPYRLVRHPGYLGFVMAMVAEAFMLGSYWSLLPVAAVLVVVMKRALVEERFLRESLAGYVEYARVVRYRLAPAVW